MIAMTTTAATTPAMTPILLLDDCVLSMESAVAPVDEDERVVVLEIILRSLGFTWCGRCGSMETRGCS
jgi:hypothetical protein